jgi:hypothetical protein
MAGLVWEVNPEYAIVAIFDEWYAQALYAMNRILQFYAPQIEAWMKQNAAWTDRTGNLRQSLFAVMKREIDMMSIEIGYGMIYGDYVMAVGQGQYDIISNAMDYFRPKIFADVKAIFA